MLIQEKIRFKKKKESRASSVKTKFFENEFKLIAEDEEFVLAFKGVEKHEKDRLFFVRNNWMDVTEDLRKAKTFKTWDDAREYQCLISPEFDHYSIAKKTMSVEVGDKEKNR